MLKSVSMASSRLLKPTAIVYATAFALCPSRASFNAQERLKDAIDQDFKAEAEESVWNRLARSVAVGMAAGMAEVELQNCLGVARVARVKLPIRQFVWVGLLGHWVYLGSYDEEPSSDEEIPVTGRQHHGKPQG
jgi:hypothetical protein